MELNTIQNADCFDALPTIPDESIDLIITDLPYGMSYQSNRRKEKYNKIVNDDNIDWLPSLLQQYYRLLKPNSHIYLFCNDDMLSFIKDELDYIGFKTKKSLVWIKNNHGSGDLKGDYAPQCEYIVFAHKGRRLLNGRRDSNILYFDKTSNVYHPTEKSIKLLEYLISKSSNPGDVVLDAMCGSGSTCVAAKQSGRQYIGIEIDSDYATIAQQRLII